MRKCCVIIFMLIIMLCVVSNVSASYGDYEEQPTITLFGEGTSDGNGTTFGDTGILCDGFRFTMNDYWASTNYASSADGNKYPGKNLDKFIKFTQTNSGVEFTWENKQTVSRLELWTWRLVSITDYAVQTSEDGITWETVVEGSFDQKTTAADAGAPCAFCEFVHFDSIETKHLRFVIKKFSDEQKGAYLSEIIPAKSKSPNLLAVASSKANYGTYVSGCKVSNTNANHKNIWFSNLWGGGAWPCVSSNGNPYFVTPNTNDNSCYYAVAFYSGKRVSRMEMIINKGTLKKYEIYCSNTADLTTTSAPVMSDWTKMAEGEGNFTGTVTFDISSSVTAKFWMIKFTEYEGDFRIYKSSIYEVPEKGLSSFARALNNVFDGVSDEVVVTQKLNLRENIELDGETYSIDWQTDSPNVGADGTVTRPAEDETITLTAKVNSGGAEGIRVLKKDFTICGLDKRPKTKLIEEDFSVGTAEDVFSDITSSINISEGEAVFSENSSAKIDVTLPFGFYVDKKQTFEISLGSTTDGGSVAFLSDEGTLLNISVEDGNLKVQYTDNADFTVPFSEKIKIEMVEDSYFNFYVYDNEVEKIKIYKGKLMDSKTTSNVLFSVNGGDKLCLSDFVYSVVQEELFNSVMSQFDFSKLGEERPMGLTSDLTLIDKVGDITFSYDSQDDNALGDDGKVKSTDIETLNFTVTGDNGATSLSKTFYIVLNRTNLLQGAQVTSNAFNPSVDYVTDNSLENEYTTPATYGYRIQMDMGKAKYFNKLIMYEAKDTNKITAYKISVSNDNKEFTEIYSGSSIVNGEILNMGIQYARYIRINVTEFTDKNTGIAEICAMLDITDSEALEEDLKSLKKEIKFENDALIPKKGALGTAFTLVSDKNSVVYFEDLGANWKVKINVPDEETAVNITLNAVKGTSNIQTPYSVTILENPNIGSNEPSNNIGSTIPSGGGGGGGGGSFTKLPSVQEKEEKLPTEEESMNFKEITGHWAEKEIRTMLKEGIVEGNGSSLLLNDNVTRAEFVKMILKALKIETVKYQNGFKDVSKDAWYADFAQTAAKQGIMVGDSNNFRGNDFITRQEMAHVLINAYKKQIGEFESTEAASFVDSNDIAPWAYDSINAATELGLVKGYDTGTFLPLKNLRRDEAMVVIYRALECVNSEKVRNVE